MHFIGDFFMRYAYFAACEKPCQRIVEMLEIKRFCDICVNEVGAATDLRWHVHSP